MGMEEPLMVIGLPLTDLITDEMDGIIGGHTGTHILGGKKTHNRHWRSIDDTIDSDVPLHLMDLSCIIVA